MSKQTKITKRHVRSKDSDLKFDPSGNGRRIDLPKIERAVREILSAIGEDPDREGLQDTPARVARMYDELFNGIDESPEKHLEKLFQEKYDEIVLLKDIPFFSICEHHLLPFMGMAHVAYLPSGKVVGLSKLARVVEAYAHRPQLQERLTNQIADAIMKRVKPKGVCVVLNATHTCMTIRGVRKPGSAMVTSALRGIFKTDPATRGEVMALINSPR